MSTTQKVHKLDVREEPLIKNLLQRMPSHVAKSFSEEQLLQLKVVIGTRQWGKHAIDYRGTFKIPLISRRFYYVVLFGRNYRELSRQELRMSAISQAIFVSGFFVCCAVIGILVLYLIKSALGVDLIDGFSFGVWDWFKQL